jgi:hypothetical protein
MSSRPAQAKEEKPYLKNKTQTNGLGAWLKYEGLGSIPNITHTKKMAPLPRVLLELGKLTRATYTY